jgi:Rrf2 family protein
MTRAADYAVRAIVHLASLPGGSRATLGELAAGVDVPPAFLSKVLQRLVTAGLVISRRGKCGGFELSSDIASVSLLDVLGAFDSVPALNACLAPGGCARSATCGAHPVWVEAQHRLHEVLAGASLDRIARATRARQHRTAARRRTAGHDLDEHRVGRR